MDRSKTRHETLLAWCTLLSKAPAGHVVVCQPNNHEIALMGGRPDPADPHLINQISMRVGSLDDLRAMRRRFASPDGVWSRAGRGEVFATGNYSFLRMRRALTDKLLDNVWRKLVG